MIQAVYHTSSLPEVVRKMPVPTSNAPFDVLGEEKKQNVNEDVEVHICHLPQGSLIVIQPCVELLCGFGVEGASFMSSSVRILLNLNQIWLRAV